LPTDLRKYYRAIPSVQELLQTPEILENPIDNFFKKIIIQEEIERIRLTLSESTKNVSFSPDEIPNRLQNRIVDRLNALLRPRQQKVINATGIILHTNLGRAPLSKKIIERLKDFDGAYSNLEFNLKTGKRGERNSLIEELLCLVTGAEAGMMVNNNAAAVLLVLNTLCKRKEVPVSRGELVEIGGSFRMPDVMKASGAKMVEVGTTNKTHLKDYQQALNNRTGAILKVHTSNYRILGFTAEVALPDLIRLSQQHHLPLIYDMGSGVLEDLAQFGLPHEPVVRKVLAMGVDVVTFSGDKMLGGPQAGLIVGKKEYVQKIKRNPLTRALRCDKLTYAAMEETLRAYLNQQDRIKEIPTYEMLTTPLSELQSRAKSTMEQVHSAHLSLELVETYAQMGSGALPLEKIPSVALAITSSRLSPQKLAGKLREFNPPIIGYVQDDKLFLNLKTIRQEEILTIIDALNKV